MQVVPHSIYHEIKLSTDAGIQYVFRRLINDLRRTEAIATEVVSAFGLERKVLVLTERTEHLATILSALDGRLSATFVLHGQLSKKLRPSEVSHWQGIAAHGLVGCIQTLYVDALMDFVAVARVTHFGQLLAGTHRVAHTYTQAALAEVCQRDLNVAAGQHRLKRSIWRAPTSP